jgi:acetamidase/formamidase
MREGAETEAVMRQTIAAAILLVTGCVTADAETHRFVPTTYYNTFSFAHPPALRIKPGDRVITTTIDAGGMDANDRRVASGPNPQTGPFYIEGAEPGDMLVVTLNRIEPNRMTARSATLLAPYAIDPAFLRSTAERQGRQETWMIDRGKGIARTTSNDLRPGGLEVPLNPMLGCIGTAPRNKEAVSTATPGTFGGNMDYAGMVVGVRVMLPVYEPGALLFVGDGHARQGHGEVVGTGLETSMDVEFTVNLVKKKVIGWPRLENDDYIMVLGSERPLLQAFQHATTELLRWLMSDYGFDERTASMLMGQAVEYEIANVVDPHFTVVAKLRKTHLRPR